MSARRDEMQNLYMNADETKKNQEFSCLVWEKSWCTKARWSLRLELGSTLVRARFRIESKKTKFQSHSQSLDLKFSNQIRKNKRSEHEGNLSSSVRTLEDRTWKCATWKNFPEKWPVAKLSNKNVMPLMLFDRKFIYIGCLLSTFGILFFDIKWVAIDK